MSEHLQLKILLPNEVFLEQSARKITAEAANGHFCLLPHHVDFVAALVPGLLTFEDASGTEHFVAVDDGVLVKTGTDVMVATRMAVAGGDLGQLANVIQQQFKVLDEHERVMRSAAARLEAGLVRRFVEFDKSPAG